jgi:hypothetical protein
VHNGETPETEKLIYSYSLSKDASISERMENNWNYKGCVGYKSMATLEERLKIWIEAHCLEENPRPQRVFELNAILREIHNDRRFWQYRNVGNCGFYEDALSNMWLYFYSNLCEVRTARKRGSFLETRHYAVGRLLINLKGHLKNIPIGPPGPFISPGINPDDPPIDPPDVEPDIAVQQYEALIHLLETDPTGELNAQTYILQGKTTTQKPYELTAQTYLLMRYRDDMTIHQIADQLEIPRGALSGTKPTKWKALAQKYAQMAIESVVE